MNLVSKYLEKKYILLKNISNERRYVCGSYLIPGEIIAMEPSSANTFLSMLPDPSWIVAVPFSSIEELKQIVDRLDRAYRTGKPVLEFRSDLN